MSLGVGVWLVFVGVYGMYTRDKIIIPKRGLCASHLDIGEWIGAYYPSNY